MSGLGFAGFRTPLGSITLASIRQASAKKMNNMASEDWDRLEIIEKLPRCDLNGKKIR